MPTLNLWGTMENAAPSQGQHGSLLLAECLKTLREREADLHERGILHAAIFGSVARGDNRIDSDVDILVEVQRGAGFDVYELVGLQEELKQTFGRPVDVLSKGGLKSPKHDHILMEMIQAF